ncbi:MAG: Thioredoxin protein [Flavipsychrobacter sp.]|jgi:rhodanese-related sulfurtransferase|nr:Thioredoxin protein [Flavipsychrobacter sp.]
MRHNLFTAFYCKPCLTKRNLIFAETTIAHMVAEKFRLSLITLLLLVLCSCSFAQNNNQLSPKEFSKVIASDGVQLIDVRTPDEYEQEHLESAINSDWNGDVFDEETSVLDKNKPVYVYCQSGNRSAKAAAHLRKAGFKEVYELKGGMKAWQLELLTAPPKTEKDEEE